MQQQAKRNRPITCMTPSSITFIDYPRGISARYGYVVNNRPALPSSFGALLSLGSDFSLILISAYGRFNQQLDRRLFRTTSRVCFIVLDWGKPPILWPSSGQQNYYLALGLLRGLGLFPPLFIPPPIPQAAFFFFIFLGASTVLVPPFGSRRSFIISSSSKPSLPA